MTNKKDGKPFFYTEMNNPFEFKNPPTKKEVKSALTAIYNLADDLFPENAKHYLCNRLQMIIKDDIDPAIAFDLKHGRGKGPKNRDSDKEFKAAIKTYSAITRDKKKTPDVFLEIGKELGMSPSSVSDAYYARLESLKIFDNELSN